MTPKSSWRYKMTVEVNTPDVVRSGSAVREVSYSDGGAGLSGLWIGESRPQWRVQGQAVIVPLPNGKNLFALLRGASVNDVEYGARIADRALGERGRIVPEGGSAELYPTAPKTGGLAQTNPLPMLATFADPKDVRTIEPVDPHNLAARLGQGYALRRVTIDIVTDPITTGIDDVLPSFGEGSGFAEWYRSLKYGDPRRLGPEHFKRSAG